MKKSVIVLLHLLYWTCFILLIAFILLAIQQGRNGNALPGSGLVSAFYLSAIVPGLIAFYSFYTILFTRFLTQKRIWAFIVSGILVCVLSGLSGAIGLTLAFGSEALFADGFKSAFEITSAIAILVALPNGAIGLVLKGFISWYGDIRLKAELSQKNHETELALVKSHINPHFLFNTINNIDVLIAKDAVKASDYLNKLSDIMRFMLYETKAEKIELKKELSYIEKYIALQKIRSSRTDYVSYNIEGNSDGITIAPFVFIPFIENAFKYATQEENAIRVKFTVQKDRIVFNCENRYTQNAHSELKQGGLGNELIARRLLLLYPERHTLEIKDEQQIYKVKLSISIDVD